jgi:hypothetical protein
VALAALLIAGGGLGVVRRGKAIEESVDLAFEIFNRVFRKVPERIRGERQL